MQGEAAAAPSLALLELELDEVFLEFFCCMPTFTNRSILYVALLEMVQVLIWLV